MLEHALADFSKEIHQGTPGYVLFVDAGGLGASAFRPSHLKILKQISDDNAQNYPECAGKVIVFNTPWIFPKFWHVIKTMLDPVTVEKIEIHAKLPVEKLRKHFDATLLPKELGGDKDNTY